MAYPEWLFLQVEPLERDEFFKRWKHALGESFEDQVDLSLLSVRAMRLVLIFSILRLCISQGNYVMLQTSTSQKLKYFASADLPHTPAELFGELFLTQPRWKRSDIVPFLNDSALNEKESEKLLMKNTRVTTDSNGVAW